MISTTSTTTTTSSTSTTTTTSSTSTTTSSTTPTIYLYIGWDRAVGIYSVGSNSKQYRGKLEGTYCVYSASFTSLS